MAAKRWSSSRALGGGIRAAITRLGRRAAPWRRLWHRGTHYWLTERHWRAAILIAALVVLAKDHVGWVRVIDGYAFATIANLTGVPTSMGWGPVQARRDEPIVILALDQRVYDSRKYAARSPLDRCALHEDLGRIYDAGPRLLVIDFDLSPTLLVAARRADWGEQARCQTSLDELIGRHGKATVLMAPSPVDKPQTDERWDAARQTEVWRSGMKRAEVRFGDPEVLLEYGLVSRMRVDADSLVGTVAAAIGEKVPPKLVRINPARVRRVVDTVKLGPDLSALRDRIVFFGGTWDVPGGDLYLTPMGELYGVEIHAAGLASLRGKVIESTRGAFLLLVIDVCIALVFGHAAMELWRSYFTSSQRPEAGDYGAAVWVFLLVVAFGLLVGVVVYASLWLLRSSGVWASPIPIALGVAIESFAVKSVEVAKELLERRGGPGYSASGHRVRAVIWWRWVVVGAVAMMAILLHD